MSAPRQEPVSLARYAWLPTAAAVVNICLNSVAYLVTGSVGLLSDAAESVVNLVAAIIALVALMVAARPADAGHHYGHGKAEYFSAGLEGLMIFAAAAVILLSAADRFIHPAPLERVGLGLAISALATLVNGAVGWLLIRVGRQRRSATLTADGKHLMTDVWTSVGVLVGVLLVAVTGWQRLDPVVAVIVGINILVTGGRLVAQSVRALLDQSIGPRPGTFTAALHRRQSAQVTMHVLQTRGSGGHRFASMHVRARGNGPSTRNVPDDGDAAVRDALPAAACRRWRCPKISIRSMSSGSDGSTWKKSHASIVAAWVRRNCRQLVSVSRIGAENDIEVVSPFARVMLAYVVPVQDCDPFAERTLRFETEPELAAVSVRVDQRRPRVRCLSFGKHPRIACVPPGEPLPIGHYVMVPRCVRTRSATSVHTLGGQCG